MNWSQEYKPKNRESNLSIQPTIKDSIKIKIEESFQPEYHSQTNSFKHSDNKYLVESFENSHINSLLILRVKDCLSLGINQLNLKVLADEQVKLDEILKLNEESTTSNYIKLPFNRQEWINPSSEIEYQLKFKK